MTTNTADRLLGLALLSLLLTAVGELLAVPLLATVGVAAFFVSLAGLLGSMTLSLLVGISRLSGPDMRPATRAERAR